jgi:ribose-phosphate pyrophosphokinase
VPNDLKIFTGNGNRELAKEISASRGIPLGLMEVGQFGEGEIRVKINENVRGTDVFIIQSTCPPVNDTWMELLIVIDAMRRASARRITAVIPFYSYGRQDRKDQPRVPITAKLVANLIEAAGTDRVLTMDLHADQIQGFFDIPLDHLMSMPVFADWVTKKKLGDVVVAAPDLGGVKDARYLAEKIGAPLAIVDKRRFGPVQTAVQNVIGDVKDKVVVMSDDIITSGSSIAEAALALKQRGARDIYALVTHGIFSGPVVERLRNSGIKEIVVTNTVPLNEVAKKITDPPVRVLSVASMFGEAIRRIHEEASISALFH